MRLLRCRHYMQESRLLYPINKSLHMGKELPVYSISFSISCVLWTVDRPVIYQVHTIHTSLHIESYDTIVSVTSWHEKPVEQIENQ